MFKKYITILLLLLCLSGTHAQNSSSTSAAFLPKRPHVGIALSGGGAKGAAHIGVLKYIDEIGIPIDYITGTSMGSIIGGLYALGYTPDEMAYLIANLDWNYYMSNNVDRKFQSSANREQGSRLLVSIPFGNGHLQEKSDKLISTLPGGVINGTSLINLFSRLSIGFNDSVNFDQLSIPFACVATDILTGDSVILRKGNFAKAIRSSMAIPGVFSPIQWDNHLLADGGLVNNFPVDVCLQMGADYVIGVGLASQMATTPEELKSLPQQAMQYLSIAVNGTNDANRELCDVFLHPDIDGYNMLSFTHDAIDTMIRRGYECAKAHHDELMELKKRLEQFGPCISTRTAPRAKYVSETDTFVLAQITYNGISDNQRDWLQRKSGLTIGIPSTISDIERAVGILEGSGFFSGITYNIYQTEEEYWLTHPVYSDALGLESYHLVLNLHPAEPHIIGFGFRYDSKESASILFHAGWNERRLGGHKAALELDFNYNLRMHTRFSYCGLGIGDLNLGYKYHNTDFYLYASDGITLIRPYDSKFDHNEFSFYFSEFHLRNFKLELGFKEDIYSSRNAEAEGSIFYVSDFSNATASFGVYMKGRFDNLDDSYFATTGSLLNYNIGWNKENRYLFGPADGRGFANVEAIYLHYLSPSPRLTFIPQISMRAIIGGNTHWYDNIIGGSLPGRYLDHQLPFIGLIRPIVTDDIAAIARLDCRVNVWKKFYIFAMANYFLATDNLNFNSYDSGLGCGIRMSYKSPMGPISWDIQWNSLNRSFGSYINIGYIF